MTRTHLLIIIFIVPFLILYTFVLPHSLSKPVVKVSLKQDAVILIIIIVHYIFNYYIIITYFSFSSSQSAPIVVNDHLFTNLSNLYLLN